ncbi:hypothetical protein [Pseudomonas sp. PWP3-1b2]|uniref:hypothetical protein n=1 Tax=Pseudomonas sp. PWP3-1b2 TaxID=2804656 RepID=UPI003CF6C1A0
MAQGFVNDRTTDYLSLKSRLIDSASSRQRAEHFDALNRHLRPGLVTPGQLVIVPDTYSVSCSLEEAWLMRYAQEVRRDLDASTGSAVINNYDLLQYLETGRLAGSAVGAAAIGKLGSRLALRACVMVLGISMKASGQLACGIVGGAAGGDAGGSRGGDSGAFFGGKVLEINGELIFQPEGA